jgi:hypothetical protein
MKKITWFFFIFFAVLTGLYPLTYLLVDMSAGFLASKPPSLLQSKIWNVAFNLHIFPGAIALLTGWSQFSKRIRNNNLSFHRALGKVYLLTVAVSSVAAFYLSFFATGGLIAGMGFAGLAIGWFFTTATAYVSIRSRNVDQHQYWMIRSYALCWAAVTLRIWLPLLQAALGMEFIMAYRIIAWLCWVPNLIVAELIVRYSITTKLRVKALHKGGAEVKL